ncbi:Protein SYS1 homolog [Anthophora plagiata]
MNNISGQFRKTIWDPFLIISQIIAIQTVMYFCLGLWIWIVATFIGSTNGTMVVGTKNKTMYGFRLYSPFNTFIMLLGIQCKFSFNI